MPFHHEYWISTMEEINMVLSYNKNDVIATNKFLDITLGNTENPLYKGKNKIELRQRLMSKYRLPCLNWNDIKLGTELILKLYCEKFKLDPKVVKQQRTYRSLIKIKECLPSWTNFETKEFNKLIDYFSKSEIKDGVTKNTLSYSIIFHGFKFDYGTGGCHGCISPGVYDSDDKYMILDLDIDGMYPNLAITQLLYPQHLGLGFIDIYDGEIVSVRTVEKKKPKKERDFIIVEGFKLAANGSYGKSNSEDSYLYDPLYSMKTTISGQILISMWAETLIKAAPTAKILQVNTDGITLRILRSDYQKCIDASDVLMTKTKMSYEINTYSKMIINDVNNYAAKYDYGECKYKGLFEIDKELHKDPSSRIVAIALSEYFLNKVPVSDTITNHKNIYDFCLRLKVNKGWKALYKYIDDDLQFQTTELSKNTRYYISNKGGALYKKSVDNDKPHGVNVGYITTIFNHFIKKKTKEYNINYSYYIKECNKIIEKIENKQLELF